VLSTDAQRHAWRERGIKLIAVLGKYGCGKVCCKGSLVVDAACVSSAAGVSATNWLHDTHVGIVSVGAHAVIGPD